LVCLEGRKFEALKGPSVVLELRAEALCLERDVNPNIPLKANRVPQRWAWDEDGYRERNRV
jgi:hypothetical protein